MKRKTLLIMALLSSVAVQAQAETGWYVSGDLGRQYEDSEARHAGTNAADTPSYDLEDSSIVGGVAAGYDLGNSWRLEGELRQRKMDTDRTSVNGTGIYSSDSFSLDGELESTTMMANALYDFKTQGKLKPYIKAGVGIAQHDASATLDGDLSGTTATNGVYGSSDETEFAWAIGGGVSYPIQKNLSLDLEYQYIDMGSVSTSSDANGDSVNFDAASHEVTAGVTYRF